MSVSVNQEGTRQPIAHLFAFVGVLLVDGYAAMARRMFDHATDAVNLLSLLGLRRGDESGTHTLLNRAELQAGRLRVTARDAPERHDSDGLCLGNEAAAGHTHLDDRWIKSIFENVFIAFI